MNSILICKVKMRSDSHTVFSVAVSSFLMQSFLLYCVGAVQCWRLVSIQAVKANCTVYLYFYFIEWILLAQITTFKKKPYQRLTLK